MKSGNKWKFAQERHGSVILMRVSGFLVNKAFMRFKE